MKKFIFILILAGVTAGAQAQTAHSNLSKDSILINAVINEFYQTLSFNKVDANRLDDLTRFFIPQGLLISNVGKGPLFWTANQYISSAKENFQKQQVSVWEEKEVCSRTEIFGKVAQRFSTYRIRIIANGNESHREGINAIQFIKQNDTWLITAVAWDKEGPDQKIPAKYTCNQPQ